MPRKLISKAIQVDQISLEHCDWYSQDTAAGENTGALKIPRGNTSERPNTHTGGRENIEISVLGQPDEGILGLGLSQEELASGIYFIVGLLFVGLLYRVGKPTISQLFGRKK